MCCERLYDIKRLKFTCGGIDLGEGTDRVKEIKVFGWVNNLRLQVDVSLKDFIY
jgi:hypothetical protein